VTLCPVSIKAEELLGPEWLRACRGASGYDTTGSIVALPIAVTGLQLRGVHGAPGLEEVLLRLKARDRAAATEIAAACYWIIDGFANALQPGDLRHCEIWMGDVPAFCRDLVGGLSFAPGLRSGYAPFCGCLTATSTERTRWAVCTTCASCFWITTRNCFSPPPMNAGPAVPRRVDDVQVVGNLRHEVIDIGIPVAVGGRKSESPRCKLTGRGACSLRLLVIQQALDECAQCWLNMAPTRIVKKEAREGW
jgi:hypothetical protein